MREETDNRIILIQILKNFESCEVEKIFIIKSGKSNSIISADEDGLIKSFHLATSIFFK